MNFLHLSLLAGLGAMAVPVALHLLSRRQPKLITFPALRLVKHTVVHQRGSWQLRHFLLLLLRVGLFGAMAIALARPRVHSAMLTAAVGLGLVVAAAIFASLVALTAAVTRRGAAVWMPVAIIAIGLWTAAGIWTGISLTSGPVVPSSDQSAPVAAALIVDTGPSLDYRAENAKRFEAAKEMADWILSQLPLDSRVGILTGAPIGALSLDPATAKGQIHVLQPQAAHIDLPARLRTAIDLVQANSLERKEVYVITDLMRSSWAGATPDLPTLLKDQAREVLVQIIDVGTEQSTNWRLGEVETLSQVVPEGGDAEFRVSVSRSPNTPGASTSVELYQEQIDPRLPIISNGQLKLPPSRVVDREIVDLTQAADAQVTLSAHSLTPGTHNFHIKLTIPDPLEIDNTRYITVVCQAQQAALVVSDDADNARFLRLALSPSAESDSPANLADTSLTQQVRYNQLAQVDLDRYRVVYLNDPPSLPPSTVSMLESHVKQGGGLFITLGPSIGSVDQAQASPLARLLPGKLARIGRRPQSDSSLFLVPVSVTHPLFHIFGPAASDVPWNVYPLYRVWEIESIKDDVQVLMTTSQRGLAALLLERLGNGQILTLTTPLPATNEAGEVPWNALTSASYPWPAFGLLVGGVRLLSGQSQTRTNFSAGETVSLPNDPKVYPTFYELYSPAGQSRRVQAANGMLLLGNLDQAGTYHLRGLQGSSTSRGVSVNTPADDTQLARMEPSDLDSLLGADNYRLARKRSEVESSVGQARYGRELFPLMMACVAALFLAEQAMSNRFYKLQLTPARAPR